MFREQWFCQDEDLVQAQRADAFCSGFDTASFYIIDTVWMPYCGERQNAAGIVVASFENVMSC